MESQKPDKQRLRDSESLLYYKGEKDGKFVKEIRTCDFCTKKSAG